MGINVKELKMRLAEKSDARVMADIISKSWSKAYNGIIPDDFIEAKNNARIFQFERIMSETNKENYIVQLGTEDVGLFMFGEMTDNDLSEFFIELKAIYLLPEYFRQGIGTEIVNYCLEMAKSLKKRYMSLWVLSENFNAIAFYESLGFRFDGKIDIKGYGKALELKRMVKSIYPKLDECTGSI